MELNSVEAWELTLSEYLTGNWGNVIGREVFKAPATFVETYTIEVTDPVDGTVSQVFQEEDAFNSIAQTYIDAVVSHYGILRQVKMEDFEVRTKRYLREAIYEAVQYALLNRQVWEKINTSSVSASGLSISNDATGWLVTVNMFGKKGMNKLTKSEISEWKLIDEEALSMLVTTASGNIQVLKSYADIEDALKGSI